MSEASQGGQPGEKNKSPQHNQDQSKDQTVDSPPIGSPIIAKVKPTPPNTNYPDQKKERFCKKYKDEFEVVAIVGGFVLLVFNVLAYCQMVKATNASVGQLAEMQEAKKLDERAWISINNPTGVGLYSPQGTIGLSVHYENTGKTPATVNGVEIRIGISHEPFTTTNWIIDEKSDYEQVIAPNSRPASVWHETNPITEEEFAALTERKSKHCFMWKITYRDVFGYIRHTDQGFIITGPAQETTNGTILKVFGSRMD